VLLAAVTVLFVAAAGLRVQGAAAVQEALLPSMTTSTVHDASDSVVTVVAAGSTVHDDVTVSGGGGNPVPTGSVMIDWFATSVCAGSPVATSPPTVLVGGSVNATAFPQEPLSAGSYGFEAHYGGDSTYAASDGPCEALQVVDADIQVASNGTDQVNSTHSFTGHVDINAGTGAVNAPAGTLINFTFNGSNVGSLSSPSCTTVGTTGSCTVTDSSPTPGVDTVNATATASVAGLNLTRTTDGMGLDSGPAVEIWVDSYITINPTTATNVLGATQTFTAQVFTNDGGGAGYIAANGVTVTFTLLPGAVGSFTGTPPFTCVTSGSGACTITTTSSTVGNDTVQAAATVTVSGVTMTPTTGTSTPGHSNGADAVEQWDNPPPPPPPSNPAISITKNPKTQTIGSGATASFTIAVTNTGNVTLTNVTVSDTLAPGCNASSATNPTLASMAPGATLTYNCSLANVTASFTNSASATGTPPSGPNVSATDTAPVTVVPPLAPPPPPTATPSHPSIAITNDPHLQTIPVNGTATFTITVTNTGDVTLSDVGVTDALSPDCGHTLGRLAVGRSKSYACNKTGVQADFINVADATGKPPTGPAVKASDRASVSVKSFVPPIHPKISVVIDPKTQTHQIVLPAETSLVLPDDATSTPATTLAATIPVAKFTIKVTNVGNVPLTDVKVVDATVPDCQRTTLGTLAPGAAKIYDCTRPLNGVFRRFENVATASGKSLNGDTVMASYSAEVVMTTGHLSAENPSPSQGA
jgi:uncharacterized repeat protein (TIGR01451 family)